MQVRLVEDVDGRARLGEAEEHRGVVVVHAHAAVRGRVRRNRAELVERDARR